jgi:hypothetical protein
MSSHRFKQSLTKDLEGTALVSEVRIVKMARCTRQLRDGSPACNSLALARSHFQLLTGLVALLPAASHPSMDLELHVTCRACGKRNRWYASTSQSILLQLLLRNMVLYVEESISISLVVNMETSTNTRAPALGPLTGESKKSKQLTEIMRRL